MAKKFFMGTALGVAAVVCSLTAQAAYTVTLTQVGTAVVATGSGSFNLGGLGAPSPGLDGGAIDPQIAGLVLGPAVSPVDEYAVPMSGPAAFGAGAPSLQTSGSGAIVGLNRSGNAFSVPVGYVANAPLGASTSTWSGQTIASMGVTPGTYVWTWGAGPTADSYTLIINAAPSGATNIPTLSEWGTIFLASLLGMLGFATLRRRRN